MKTGITKWHGKRVFTLATKANVEAMHKAALLLQKDIKTHFTGTKAGSVAREKARRAAGGKMQIGGISPRSKPGQPPAVQLGNLLNSIQFDVTVVGGINVIGKVGVDEEYLAAKTPVGTDVKYGLYLEVGTSKMAPRPYLQPALKRTRRKVNKIFRKANS